MLSRTQGRQTFFDLGQRDFGGRQRLLLLLPSGIALTDLALGAFEASLQRLDPLIRFIGLGLGLTPCLIHLGNVMLQDTDLGATQCHFFGQSLVPLAMLTEARSRIGLLLRQNLDFLLQSGGLGFQIAHLVSNARQLGLGLFGASVQLDGFLSQLPQLAFAR